jgi:MFS family permease
VLINGERFSGKSTDIFTELRRISAANVTRIEIVDGATLNVPGLSGQVANVVTASRGLSGNYVWRPQQRLRRTPFRWSNGEISLNGPLGGSDFTVSLRNDSFRNGNAGPELVVALVAVLLMTSVTAGTFILVFAFAKESVPARLGGTVSGIANMGVMLGGMLLQPIVGLVLDAHWSGEVVNGTRTPGPKVLRKLGLFREVRVTYHARQVLGEP